MVVVLLVAFLLNGVIFSLGQKVGFEQGDILATGSDIISIRVNKFEYNSAPITISVHPLTISQYEALGVGDCDLSAPDDPAEADDFNTTVMEVFVPADTNPMVYTFNIALTQDNVVEPLEDFVVFLNVSGGDSLTVTRNCMLIKIKEVFNGQFLRWTHDGQEVTSMSLSLSYPEGNASHVIVKAERLVEAEVTTTITIMEQIATLSTNEFSIPSSYSIPPEISFVNIVLTLFDDSAIESDETLQIDVTAEVPHLILGTYRSRRVQITVTDNEVLNYEFLSPAHVTVTEGDSIIVMSGLNPMVVNNFRNNQIGRITTESGTATEGIDFHRVDGLVFITNIIHNQEVRTISRAGVQPTRSFTVHLAPLFASNYTLIHGVVVIEILDKSQIPLAPFISSLILVNTTANTTDRKLKVTWYQESTETRPIENVSIIIKSCSEEHCEINLDDGDDYNNLIMISYNEEPVYVYQWDVDEDKSSYVVVVCASNLLGENCSSVEKIIVQQIFTDTEQIIPSTTGTKRLEIPLAPSISSFGFFKDDSDEIEATWSQEVSDLRPLDNFLVIFKACTELPCEIDPNSPKEDEQIQMLPENTKELLILVNSKTGLFEIVVCAENILGRNCTSSFIQIDPPTKVDLVDCAGDVLGSICTSSTSVDPTNATLVAVAGSSSDRTYIVPVVIICILIILLCCLPPLIFLIMFCCCKEYKETSYYPRKKEAQRENHPDLYYSFSYTDEVKYGDLKYVS